MENNNVTNNFILNLNYKIKKKKKKHANSMNELRNGKTKGKGKLLKPFLTKSKL